MLGPVHSCHAEHLSPGYTRRLLPVWARAAGRSQRQAVVLTVSHQVTDGREEYVPPKRAPGSASRHGTTPF